MNPSMQIVVAVECPLLEFSKSDVNQSSQAIDCHSLNVDVEVLTRAAKTAIQ